MFYGFQVLNTLKEFFVNLVQRKPSASQHVFAIESFLEEE